jgi:hypothetical protein
VTEDELVPYRAMIELLGERRARDGAPPVNEIREVSPTRRARPSRRSRARCGRCTIRRRRRVDGRLLNQRCCVRQRGGV